MSNYTNENLIIATAKTGERAIKIGDKIFVGLDSGGGSPDFYKCASVRGPYDVSYYLVSGAGTSTVNGHYYDTGTSKDGHPIYSLTNSGITYYLFYDSSYEEWFIHTSTSFEDAPTDECFYHLSDYEPDSWYVGGAGTSPAPTVEFTTETIVLPKTWTGNKAIYNSLSGIYNFEDTITSGLTWNLIQPLTGNVYTSDAMIKVDLYTGMPIAGLDFYLPLNTHMNDTVHNYFVNTSEDYDNEFTISSDTTGGFLHCNKTNGYSSNRIYWPDTANQYAYGTENFSISFWLRAPNWSSNYDGSQVILSKKTNDSETGFVLHRAYHEDKLLARLAYTNDLWSNSTTTNANWVHWCVVRENGIGYWYRNGVQDASGGMTGSFNSSEPFNIGYHSQSGWQSNAQFDLKALRIYNRALTPSEVAALFNEF